jgi:starvation-inducible outer membrane lipoprotein
MIYFGNRERAGGCIMKVIRFFAAVAIAIASIPLFSTVARADDSDQPQVQTPEQQEQQAEQAQQQQNQNNGGG